MITYVVKRTLQSVTVLFLVSLFIFFLVHVLPASPFTVMHPTPEMQDMIQQEIRSAGLDRPVYLQYFAWMNNILHGNFGYLYHGNVAVGYIVWLNLRFDILFIGGCWMLALLIAVPWSMHNSSYPYAFSDISANIMASIGFAFPVFWVGFLFQEVFAMKLFWFPPSSLHNAGRTDFPDLVPHLVLPVVVMTLFILGYYLKYVRSGLLDVLSSDFVRTVRAKGGKESTVRYHALRNALIPLITVLGMDFPILLTGATFLQTVFFLPGVGGMLIFAVQHREYNMVVAGFVVIGFMVVLANWVADILYVIVDPRVRHSKKEFH